MTVMNPCSCNGVAWLYPEGARYHVICEACGQIETGWTAIHAVNLWNRKHKPAPVRVESHNGVEWVYAGHWEVAYTERAVVFRVVLWPEKGHFLHGVRKFRMWRKRWIPGLTFRPRWAGISCRIA